MPDDPIPQDAPEESRAELPGSSQPPPPDRPPDLVEKTYLRWQELVLARTRLDTQHQLDRHKLNFEIAECEKFLNHGVHSREETTGNRRVSRKWHCQRCENDWVGKNDKTRRPQKCPSCGSRRWDRQDYPGEAPEEIRERQPGSGRQPHLVVPLPAGADLPEPPRLKDFVPDRRTRFGED
jgi:DNA-directed RNA polymerase subunit RPC12/RpoP